MTSIPASSLTAGIARPVPAVDLEAMPLVVDLDGTLVATDTLHEGFWRALRHAPVEALKALGALALRWDKARFKAAIAQAAGPMDPHTLPYRPEILELLADARRQARPIILATGAHRAIAGPVAEYLGGFDAVLATDEVNLTGGRKLARIQEYVHGQPFAYVGNSFEDLPIWHASRQALSVAAGPRLLRAVGAAAADHRAISVARPSLWQTIPRQLRVHQWTKNGLVFLPALAAHRLLDGEVLARSAIAALAFSLLASAIYIVNDLCDLQTDRLHPTKRLRPLAAGTVSVAQGAVLALCCGLLGVVLGAALGSPTLAVLGAYATLSLSYSLKLKRVLLFDVAVLAILYCLRVVAGGVAADIALSPWMTALMIFEFFGLAMVKRSVELMRVASTTSGRAYRATDRPTIRTVGIASTLLGTLVFALYVNDPDIQHLYPHPELLWLAMPVLLYWSARLWVFEDRGVITDDPLVFVATDRVSWLAGFVIGAVLFAASR